MDNLYLAAIAVVAIVIVSAILAFRYLIDVNVKTSGFSLKLKGKNSSPAPKVAAGNTLEGVRAGSLNVKSETEGGNSLKNVEVAQNATVEHQQKGTPPK